ncbi:MAG: BatD family protein, partial [Planctomycetota bacterium]
MLQRLILLIAAMLLCVSSAHAQGREEVSLRLDKRTFYEGERIRLEVVYTGMGAPSGVQWPDVEGLEFIGDGQTESLRQFRSNGRLVTVRQVINVIEVMAPEPGSFRIPPLSVEVEGRTLSTDPVSIRIVEAPESQQLDMQVDVSTQQAFVSEPVLVTLRITSAYPLLTDNLEIITPAPRDAHTVVKAPVTGGRVLGTFSMMGGEASLVMAETNIGGRRMQLYTARQYVIPEESGLLEIPAFRVLGDLVLRRSRSVFERARTQAVSGKSASIQIEVRDVPTEGQPAGYSGLVGRIGVAMSATPERVNVGDPIELKVTVQTDLPRRLRAIDLGAIDAFRERFRISDEPEIRYGNDVAQFQWTIRPLDDGVEQIPALELGDVVAVANLGLIGDAEALAKGIDGAEVDC